MHGYSLTRSPRCRPPRWDSLQQVVKIALIGKYTGLSDAYLSVIKSLQHACMAANMKLALEWVEASTLEVGGGGGRAASAADGDGDGDGAAADEDGTAGATAEDEADGYGWL